jgi:hypothetical protein
MAQVFKKIAAALTTVCTLLALAACGPGTGGTGTGPILSSPPTNDSSGALTAASSPLTNSTVTGLWSTLDATSTVLIEVEKITVISKCVRFTFIGNWAIDANQSIVRQTQDNKLTIVFPNLQLSFSITNALGQTITTGTELNKMSSEVTTATTQCPNL